MSEQIQIGVDLTEDEINRLVELFNNRYRGLKVVESLFDGIADDPIVVGQKDEEKKCKWFEENENVEI